MCFMHRDQFLGIISPGFSYSKIYNKGVYISFPGQENYWCYWGWRSKWKIVSQEEEIKKITVKARIHRTNNKRLKTLETEEQIRLVIIISIFGPVEKLFANSACWISVGCFGEKTRMHQITIKRYQRWRDPLLCLLSLPLSEKKNVHSNTPKWHKTKTHN